MYNPFTLENKIILVTGASSGIGRATAIECSKLGATVIISARNEVRLKETYESLDKSYNQTHKMVIADLSTSEGLEYLVNNVDELDGVSSNAGILKNQVPIKFIKNEVLADIINVNTLSHVKLARDLYKKKKLKRQSSYVFTASTGGVLSNVIGNSMYDMSKSALNTFAKSCAVDFASRKIRCNAICPGMINTPMTKADGEQTEEYYKKDIETHYLLGRYGEPEEVARSIAFLLSDASSFITGISLFVDGGYSIIK